MNQAATILITGGTGLVGSALTKTLLEKNYKVIILSRYPEKYNAHHSNLSYAKWDVQQETIDVAALAEADHIIHLAGASIAEKRWTAKRKKEIVESRIKSSRLICKVLRENENKVRAVISASAIGWYGSPSLTLPEGEGNWGGAFETDPSADDFLGQTCKQWEESIEPVIQLKKRLVKLRIGIVLSNEGGAIAEFKKSLRFGLATILGNGKQIISWIHIDDLVRMFIYAVENENLSGTYNAVAPQPVSNKKLVLLLASVVRGRYFIPVHIPSFVLKIILGELVAELLKSTTVSCQKISEAGFVFQFPSVESALIRLNPT